MNKYFGLLIFTFSVNALAAIEHDCVYKDIVVTIFTDKENDLYVHLLKDGIEINSCRMKVISYDDGKIGVSIEELIRFEKISCNVKDAGATTDIEIINKGFIKSDISNDFSAAYVINNEQPLICGIK